MELFSRFTKTQNYFHFRRLVTKTRNYFYFGHLVTKARNYFFISDVLWIHKFFTIILQKTLQLHSIPKKEAHSAPSSGCIWIRHEFLLAFSVARHDASLSFIFRPYIGAGENAVNLFWLHLSNLHAGQNIFKLIMIHMSTCSLKIIGNPNYFHKQLKNGQNLNFLFIRLKWLGTICPPCT